VYVYVENRSVTISNSTINGSNLNTGDNSQQTINSIPDNELNLLIQKLLEEINKLDDEDEKIDATENAKKLHEIVNKGNGERAKKIFGWLPVGIQTTGAGVQIAEFISRLLAG
jgi:hypothetical protein